MSDRLMTDLIYSAYKLGAGYNDGEILAFFKSREMAEDFVKIQPNDTKLTRRTRRRDRKGKIIVKFFSIITEPGGVEQADNAYNGA